MSKKIKRVAILGSTGTIGANTLNIIRRFSDRFRVEALTAFNNHLLLEQQVREFRPKYVAVSKEKHGILKKKLGAQWKTKVYIAPDDLEHIVSLKSVDVVVIGMGGSSALNPFLAAVKAGKRVAPANKEALVIAGHLIMKSAQAHQATIIPVDSEQSAIFQALEGNNRKELKKVYLTASGGALLHTPLSRFSKLTVIEILKHPRWKMGRKITVDSATMMNKGFEVIEAMRLFQLRADQIQVVVHPEAIIHSMVEYMDGAILAQLSITDMRIPIQYALTYPERWETGLSRLDFIQLGQLNFQSPDLKKFPCLALALEVARKMGTSPAVLNAADEVLVEAFLQGQISFTDIYHKLEKVLHQHKSKDRPTLKDILEADLWARDMAKGLFN